MNIDLNTAATARKTLTAAETARLNRACNELEDIGEALLDADYLTWERRQALATRADELDAAVQGLRFIRDLGMELADILDLCDARRAAAAADGWRADWEIETVIGRGYLAAELAGSVRITLFGRAVWSSPAK